ncbi:unnamed protein product [Rotaria magnacalcarata]|uniref:EGF-like domain-containing protein n=1 Tax=Rotaria magnacalcarata TaxID=392030 RepID=A0A816NJB6_9BILA|nr:unnamed protein product [Rotaria magnacalcarata]CAF1521061.1 unnamed protein product [Rotaria magnacalcarata]CAF2035328.1 unnamed protein product [Rotaria magnacalcarata]
MVAFRSQDTIIYPYPCSICVDSGKGICLNNKTCDCFSGFIGPTCVDPVTTSIAHLDASQINIAAIVAGVLGGALFATIISLVLFFIWKKRMKKKACSYSPSTSTTPSTSLSSIPIVAPALYSIAALSRRSSSVTSAPTLTYHLYEELL